MSSRVLAGVLAAGCLTAAAGGAYMAVRQNVVEPVPVAASPAPAPTSPAAAPVSETEAIIVNAGRRPGRPSRTGTRNACAVSKPRSRRPPPFCFQERGEDSTATRREPAPGAAQGAEHECARRAATGQQRRHL